jgi:ribosomal protein S18 acetylase RimI-like enzyme
MQAESDAEIAQTRDLFLEYAKSLGFSLCFQNFDQELAGLPGEYASPHGRLLLAEYDGQLKRLYLRTRFRGKGLGRALAETIIAEARAIGYRRMRLDTVEPVMKDALGIYRRLGFKEIPPYRANPIAGALYMELQL